MLMLDAAYPPGPAQLVADCQSIGAGAVAPYVFGGYTNYTAAHYDALRAAGIHLLPIVVPGDNPPTYGELAQDLSSSGVQGGPVIVDLERFSLPPAAWVGGLQAAIPGVRWGRYGGAGTLAAYPDLALDFEWISAWVGPTPGQQTVAPIPPGLPAAWDAWQYAHAVAINGSQYDVSLINPDVFGGPEMDPQTLARLQALLAALAGDDSNGQAGGADYRGLRYWLAGGGQFDPAQPTTSPNAQIIGALSAVLAGEKAGGAGGAAVDLAPVLAAIGAVDAKLDRILAELHTP